jgi:predicted nucleotidyltransferase
VRRPALAEADRQLVAHRLAGRLGEVESALCAYLFGSFVEGGTFEDVDVAVLLDPDVAAVSDLLAFQLELAAALEKAAGLPVDVILLNDAPLGLRMAAVRGRLLLSRDEHRRLAYVEQTCLQAMDMAHMTRQSLQELLVPGPRKAPEGGTSGAG